MPCSDHLHSEIIIYLLNMYYWESILSKQYNELKLKGCLELSTKFTMYDKLLDSHSNLPLISC